MSADALYDHALELLGQGRLSEAVAAFEQVIGRDPQHAEAHYRLGYALSLQGRFPEADAHCQQALMLSPAHVDALCNKAYILIQQGRSQEAEACYRQAIVHDPAHVKAHYNLATLLLRQRRLEEAGRSLEQVVRLQPELAEAHYNLGLVRLHQDRISEALAGFRRALELRPGHAESYYNLGTIDLAAGRLDDALQAFQQALLLNPAYAEAAVNLGNVYQQQGKFPEAATALRRAIGLKADLVEAYVSLSTVLTDMRCSEEALESCDRALALSPGHAEALNNRGNALRDLYRLEESQECYSRALVSRPDFALAYANRLLGLLYQPGVRPEVLYREHCGFAERFETPLKVLWAPHANARKPERRLKIGYVSGDFRRHSVAYFLEPIWAHHDSDQIEVYAYYNAAQEDEVTVRLRGYTDHWRMCAGWADERLAAQIVSDGIDVLVDLSGHTGKNRLLTFARKPAPVQVTYLGYAATTGLAAMDWRLTHADVDPEGDDACYSERLYRLPGSLWCYRPAPGLTEVSAEPPLVRSGHATFGSMNNLAKVSSETLALWAELLWSLPGARLVMTGIPTGTVRQRLHMCFANAGVDPGRVAMHDKLPYPEYTALMQQIDIALDPFPYNGTTTTCDTLWQGIPVVSLVGDSAVSRSGYALLKAVGLADLAAADPAEYVRLGIGLAGDVARLRVLRGGLRRSVEASPLRDEAGFARALEAAYRSMWRAWCMAGETGDGSEERK